MVKVETTLQVKGLLVLAFLSDGSGVSISILASLLQPANAKGVIYRVPVDLSTDELKASLNSRNVSYVRRFNFKDHEGNMRDSTTVLLQFAQSQIPEEVRVGYLQFKVKQYIPKPLRCFKCNRYGHVANYYKGKKRYFNCGGAHNWKNCDSPNKR